jgi:hypothetical protein
MSPARVLVVVHRTAATAPLVDAVRERAARGPAAFTLLVPKPVRGIARLADPEDVPDDEARLVLAATASVLEEALGRPVEQLVGSADPMAAVEDVVNARPFDEIIVATAPARFSRWLRLDLAHKVAGLGLPVTAVTTTARTPELV